MTRVLFFIATLLACQWSIARIQVNPTYNGAIFKSDFYLEDEKGNVLFHYKAPWSGVSIEIKNKSNKEIKITKYKVGAKLPSFPSFEKFDEVDTSANDNYIIPVDGSKTNGVLLQELDIDEEIFPNSNYDLVIDFYGETKNEKNETIPFYYQYIGSIAHEE